MEGNDVGQPYTAEQEKTSYSVTVYAAAPGTPMLKNGRPVGTSVAGHMFYSISDGAKINGYGFSPVQDGDSSGPGKVTRDEQDAYVDPFYKRTMEISKDQYEALRQFGEQGVRGIDNGFSMQYGGLKNSCIDFTWAALNQAGLHSKSSTRVGEEGAITTYTDKNFDGQLKVLPNIPSIKSIDAPFPDSPLNKEEHRPMPEGRSFKQWLLTEEQQRRGSGGDAQANLSDAREVGSKDYGLDQLVRGTLAAIEQKLGRSWDENSERLAANLTLAAKQAGFTDKDELRLAFNEKTNQLEAGDYALLQRRGANASPDPAANVAKIHTGTALMRDIDEVYQAVDKVQDQRLASERAQEQERHQQMQQGQSGVGARV